MTVDAAPSNSEHPVGSYLRGHGIEIALVIDDAFDPPDRHVKQKDVADFWNIVQRDTAILAELRTVMDVVGDIRDFTTEAIRHLYDRHPELPGLGPICRERLFKTKLDKMAEVKPLREYLESIGIKVVEVGSEEELPDSPAKLVFIDYFLGPADDANALKASQSRAAEIYRNVEEDAEKPFIVLMSSKPNARVAKDRFREESGLLGGLFGYLSKSDLRNRDTLYLYLATWAIGLPARHTIQRFTEALESSVALATKEFVRRIRGLGIEDYANIQWLSLQADGHPLGDYMLWMFKSLLAYLLHENKEVLAEQANLDGMTFRQFTPSQFHPTVDLAQLYRFALTEPGVDEAQQHRRSPSGADDLHLFLGDMFFKAEGGNEVLIVLNAACDLSYAPGEARSFPRDRFVLFEYGELQPIGEAPKQAAMRTDLFHMDDKVFRILWDHRKAVWKEYGQADAWLREQNFVRRTRLSLPYALELQKSFANHITRIGMPTKPPFFWWADVEVYGEGEDGKCELLGTAAGGAQLMRRKRAEGEGDEELFVLTVPCIGHIVAGLQQVFDKLNEKRETMAAEVAQVSAQAEPGAKKVKQPAEGKLQGLDGKIQKVVTLMKTHQQWLPMIQEPQPLPASGSKQEIDPKLLWVFRESPGTFAGKFLSGPPILLHIRESPLPGETSLAATATSDTIPTEKAADE